MAQEENDVLVELLVALPLQLGMPAVVVVGGPNLATHLGHRPTFPFFSGPKSELLCESRLGLLSLLCGIILCEPHCQSRFSNPTPLPVCLKFCGFFSGCLCFPCCKGTTTGEEGCCFFRGNRGSLAKMRGAGNKLNI